MNCLVKGTKILTPTGEKSIETLKAGDLVTLRHPQTGRYKRGKVVDVARRKIDKVYTVETNRGRILIGNVELYVNNHLVSLGNLKMGDKLNTFDTKGSPKRTRFVERVKSVTFRRGSFEVYDMGCNDYNYGYIANGIL